MAGLKLLYRHAFYSLRSWNRWRCSELNLVTPSKNHENDSVERHGLSLVHRYIWGFGCIYIAFIISLYKFYHTMPHFFTSLITVASDQFRQLSLLWRRHKVKAGLRCTDETQNKAETYVCSYLAPCKNPPFHDPVSSRFCCERSTQSYDE